MPVVYYHRLVTGSPCEVIVLPAQFSTWEVTPVNSEPASDEGLPPGAEVPPVPPQIASDDPRAPSLRQGA